MVYVGIESPNSDVLGDIKDLQLIMTINIKS